MIGKSLGHYEIHELLGKGGMGEVYHARDTKLGRDVAIKVLPEEVARDAERLARFRREAQMLAAVNQSNIAGIYGLEEFDGRQVLIMELAEGEDLSARLERGPIPLEEALRIASQIAEGLEEAHEKSIVHRDLKPANVMVNAEGKTKILDFGLARAYVGETTTEGDPALSPTVTAAMTQAGVILGSAAYMSPEQAKGRPVDRRTDIWAFGVILFEMITGKTLFTGETVSETMASVLKDPVAWDRLPESLPPGVRALLERCLERDPKLRLQDIGEARIHLQSPHGATVLHATPVETNSGAAAVSQGGNWWPWLFFAVASLAAMWFAFSGGGETGPGEILQLAIESPQNAGFHLTGANPAPAVLSPDGTRIVYGARSERGSYSLWIKGLSAPEAVPIAGTEGAQYPFWSPDSRSIAFYARGALRAVDLEGRTSREIVRCEDVKGGCWLEDGTILMTPNSSSGIARVNADGGELTFITDLESEPRANSHRLPRALPDGEHYLFAARKIGDSEGQPVGVMLGSLNGEAPRELMAADGQAEYASGHIIYLSEGKLFARPFDADALEFTGDPVIVAEKAGIIPGAALALFSASQNGRLVYHPGHDQTLSIQLAWFDLQGERQGYLGDSAGIGWFALSPDGRRAALTTYDNRSGTGDLYLHDVATDVRSRLTFENINESGPAWGPDSDTLYYVYGVGRSTSVIRLRPDSREAPEELCTLPGLFGLGAVSPDGRWLTLSATDSVSNRTVAMILDLENPTETQRIDTDDNNQGRALFSPDGRWIVYAASTEGENKLYLKSFPLSARKWQLVDREAAFFTWDPDGDRVLFQGVDDRLHAVNVDLTGTTPRIGSTETLFNGFAVPMTRLHTFRMTPEGTRILVTDAGGSEDVRPARLITNWPALLEASR